MTSLEMYKNYSLDHNNLKRFEVSDVIYKGYPKKLQYYMRLFDLSKSA